jgi:hypothetical protein
LRKQRPPSVHDKASRPKQPGELQPNRQTDFKSTPSKIARNLLAHNQDFFDPSGLTGQQWGVLRLPPSGAGLIFMK